MHHRSSATYLRWMKSLTVLSILSGIAFGYFASLLSPTDACRSLLSNGFINSDGMWYPSDCMIRNYHPNCARVLPSTIFFIGDSNLLPIFRSVALASYEGEFSEQLGTEEMDTSPIEYVQGPLRLCFFKESFLGDSFELLLALWANGEDSWGHRALNFTVQRNSCLSSSPTLVLVGLGVITWKTLPPTSETRRNRILFGCCKVRSRKICCQNIIILQQIGPLTNITNLQRQSSATGFQTCLY
ncbi:unnamed protein product [Dicrocoelium dendriticum]|nr:unnamed protein product [Dicrocoelium dendriticum]